MIADRRVRGGKAIKAGAAPHCERNKGHNSLSVAPAVDDLGVVVIEDAEQFRRSPAQLLRMCSKLAV